MSRGSSLLAVAGGVIRVVCAQWRRGHALIVCRRCSEVKDMFILGLHKHWF
jgi:hypothetical protein